VRIEDVEIREDHLLSSVAIESVLVEDKFNMGLQVGSFASVDAVVMMVWDALELWCVCQETFPSDVLDVESSNDGVSKFFRDGQLFIRYSDSVFGVMGENVF
jgi:hypothetical protein